MPIPHATYRIQLQPSFDFDAAAAVTDYISALGVSHFYASPYLQAAPGSTHGYDVVDPTRVNRELGGEAGHRRLHEALARAELGQVLDIVPNHMAITGPENRWWWDVLRNGPAGRYAPFFDVDWDPPESKLRNQVLMPILGDHYGRELESGALRLEHENGIFTVRYHDHVLPVAPRALGLVVARAAERLAEAEARALIGAAREAGRAGRAEDSEDSGDSVESDEVMGSGRSPELGFLGRLLTELVEPGLADGSERRRRRADVFAIDSRLRALVRSDEGVRGAIDGAVGEVNGNVELLDRLLSAQNYRVAYWRTGAQELDYRRFFDIDTLAALRTEDAEVFEAIHGRVLEWLRAGVLDGIRVDHPDGLRRPGEYFGRLREAVPDAWVVAEKILMPGEPLPPWPIDGTTGYELLNDITAVFVHPAGEAPLTALWEEVTGDGRPYHEVAYEARKDVLRDVLAADVRRLANIFVDLCESRRRYRDFTRQELRDALVEVAACFPVYRAYTGDESAQSERAPHDRAQDRDVIETAVVRAGRRSPGMDPELLGFLRDILLGEVPDDEARGLRMRFQQLTGPVAAKGEEDTAFYRYNRFVALNEVGGEPGRWGLSLSQFHERLGRRAEAQPAGMTTLSTHDTKRSEDVRARLLVLSEIPDRWADTVRGWRRRNARYWAKAAREVAAGRAEGLTPGSRVAATGAAEPDARSEHLLYQSMVGAWPIGEERISAYMEKAARESKLRTSWTDPNGAYEETLRAFIGALYASGFGDEVARFTAPLVPPGRVVSLAQKLVQLMSPGVPDIYQGTELWDLSLVDPDNRRPVDFEARRELIERLEPPVEPADVLSGMDQGLPKLWVVRQALRVRSAKSRATGPEGGYEPIAAVGPAAGHLLGFLRGGEVAVVVPRLAVSLASRGGWRGTTLDLPDARWENVLTGEAVGGGAVPASALLGRFPVALLVREGE